MAQKPMIGILGLQGDIEEHYSAMLRVKKKTDIEVCIAKTREEIEKCDGLIIPGGESTTMCKLIMDYRLQNAIASRKALMGTCAGLILMASRIVNGTEMQKPLGLLDIEVVRNAYGSQVDSFSKELEITLGSERIKLKGVFIRAPVISNVWGKTKVISLEKIDEKRNEVYAVEKKCEDSYYLGLTFHPELNTDVVHEYFAKNTYVYE